MNGVIIAVQQQHYVLPQQFQNLGIYHITNLYYAPLLGIGSGNASSLPYTVLRSMLKQRRILMRMH